MRPYQASIATQAPAHALSERLDSDAQVVQSPNSAVSLCSVDQSMLLATPDWPAQSSILWGDVFIESRLEAL